MLKHSTTLFLFLISLIFGCTNEASENRSDTKDSTEYKPPIAIAVHGGAGNILKENLDPDKEREIRAKLSEALNVGYSILNNNGSSIDAVEATIKVLEDSEYFNAGKGAVYTNKKTIEHDASIMDGKSGKAGAVAGVSTIKSPISAARAVMEKSEHVMMIGKGAAIFAEQQGLEIVDSSYFFVEERHQQILNILEREKVNLTSKVKNENEKFGTVGCVALDMNGNLAAGTSTGGMTNKKFGRVGDSPIIGAGTFAENSSVAVSATGHGEYFIRNVVAYDIAALVKYKGMSVEEAAKEVIMNKLVQKGGDGGVIAMDARGNISMPFNTAGMYRGFILKDAEPVIYIFKDEEAK